MCSNYSENCGMLMVTDDHSNMTGKSCKKCLSADKSQATIVLRKKDTYCKSCFLSSVCHKFRSCLGKSKILRPGDKVLMGFSGSVNSVALLHLIHTGLKDASHKKLMFNPFFVYIDEAAVLNLSHEDCNRIDRNINQILQNYDYPFYIVPLELSIYSQEAIDSYITENDYPIDGNKFSEFFSSFKDSTSKIDMVNKLRQNLLVQVAKSLGCNKVFTAESANDLAVNLFTNVSLGRGAQLPYDVGFSDDRFSEVKVIRPLRDLSKKELVFYNVFHGMTSVHIPSLSTKMDSHSSIQKLTECFLYELQEEFSSTLSTVFRVADKLTINSKDKRICQLCKAPLDTGHGPSSSLCATQISKTVSVSGPSTFVKHSLTGYSSKGGVINKSCYSGNSDQTSKIKLDKEVPEMLCYGCNLIFKNIDIDALPAQVVRVFEEARPQFNLRNEIEDFLL